VRSPTKEEAKRLADAHERATAVLRRLAQGKVTELDARKAYLDITHSVFDDLEATMEWRGKTR
jgi:hypothetical protein